MPREPRNFKPGIYHIVHRSIPEISLFETDKDYLRFIHLIKRAEISGEILCLEYCLMKTHVHTLFAAINPSQLSPSLMKLFGSYSHYYNTSRERFGPVWAGRCKALYLNESHLGRAIEYIRNNPVEAELVNNQSDYPWSSAKLNELRRWAMKEYRLLEY